MIREATFADIPAIVDLAVESINQNPLRFGFVESQWLIRRERRLRTAFCWVSEIEGEVVAAVGAMANAFLV